MILSGAEKEFTIRDWQYKYSLNELNWRSWLIARELAQKRGLDWGDEIGQVCFTGWKEYVDDNGVREWERGAVAQWVDCRDGNNCRFVNLPDMHNGSFIYGQSFPGISAWGRDFAIEEDQSDIAAVIEEGFKKLLEIEP